MSEQSVDVTQILDQHIYRELFDHRIIILADALEQHNANRLCTSLLLLSFRDPTADIVFLINSPGGSVPGMLAIRDCMNGIPNDVITVNLGMAYSAGQFLLSAGTQGKRFCLPHAKVLLHQGSGGIGGVAQDIEIQANDIRHTRAAINVNRLFGVATAGCHIGDCVRRTHECACPFAESPMTRAGR